MVLFNAPIKYAMFSFVFTTKVYNFAALKNNRKKMDQLIFEKRAISSKKYTYLQYSLTSALSKSSFFASQPFKTQ